MKQNVIGLDDIDMKILSILSENSRLSIRKIATRLGLKPTSVFNRIKKLERSVIMKYTTEVDQEKIGYHVTAFVLISYKSNKETQEEIAKELSKYAQVTNVAIITGEWDLLLRIVEKNVKSLGYFITKILRNKKGIDKTNTMIVLNEVKNEQIYF